MPSAPVVTANVGTNPTLASKSIFQSNDGFTESGLCMSHAFKNLFAPTPKTGSSLSALVDTSNVFCHEGRMISVGILSTGTCARKLFIIPLPNTNTREIMSTPNAYKGNVLVRVSFSPDPPFPNERAYTETTRV